MARAPGRRGTCIRTTRWRVGIPESVSSADCSGTDTNNRHYLSVGGVAIGVLVSTGKLTPLAAGQQSPTPVASIALVKVEYWHKDHLGSLVATTDHAGFVTARYAYDPFGKRRYTIGSYDAFGSLVVDWVTTSNSGTDRGYTEHEHLDDLGVIHMNGRTFDPMLGRFMQGDPLVQDPLNLQNLDRYAYCYNNPLVCTDPSGRIFDLGLSEVVFAAWAYFAARVIDDPRASAILGLAVAFYLGPSEGFFAGTASYGVGDAAIAGFASGAVNSGSFKGGIQGAFTAIAFYGAGEFGNYLGKNGVTGATQFAVSGRPRNCWVRDVEGVSGGKCDRVLSGAFAELRNSSSSDPGACCRIHCGRCRRRDGGRTGWC